MIFINITLSSNDFFPTGTIKFEPESTLNSIEPALAPLIAYVSSEGKTKVPALGFGINPFVPNNLAYGFKRTSISYVVINFSNLYVPSLIDFNISS